MLVAGNIRNAPAGFKGPQHTRLIYHAAARSVWRQSIGFSTPD